MKLNAIDIFSNWAESGKDDSMAKAHKPAVFEMLQFIYQSFNNSFSFIDAGCGNGWVVKEIISNSKCSRAIGVDGSAKMIDKAKSQDSNGTYFCSDLVEWEPKKKVDIVHSMEVLYYFTDPYAVIKHMVQNWLKPNGLLIIGVDHYIGNPDSYSWSKDLNVHMTLMSESEWKNMLEKAGLVNCNSWRANQINNSAGTLVISGRMLKNK